MEPLPPKSAQYCCIGGDSVFARLKTQRLCQYTIWCADGDGYFKELDKPAAIRARNLKRRNLKTALKNYRFTPGMIFAGVITNVTNFGAFVDVGVHQDGLVHISMLSHQFIKDPHSVVKAGDIVTVKVMEVDAARKRIALSMRLDDVPGQESKSHHLIAPAQNSRHRAPRRKMAHGRFI